MSSTILTLKHLARRFDLEPHKLRKLLRKRFTKAPHGRWAFPENDPTLESIEKFLASISPQEKKNA